MTIYILLPLLVAVVGAFIYLAAAKGELKELGRLAYATGLLVTLYACASHLVKF
jgi:hypothetical protein